MKKIILILLIFYIFCAPSNAAFADGNWRFALGYSFLTQVDELKDTYKRLARDAGNGKNVFNASLGLRFQPYYQFANGIRSGLGAGPLIMMLGDVRHFQIPLNMNLGYSFFQNDPLSVYLIAGASFHIADGDFYYSASPGFYGGIGCEILNTQPAHLGFEAAYDGAEITLDSSVGPPSHQSIKTGEVSLFLYADF